MVFKIYPSFRIYKLFNRETLNKDCIIVLLQSVEPLILRSTKLRKYTQDIQKICLLDKEHNVIQY